MEEKRDKKAREIRDSWLGKKYFFGPDSPATREGRNLVSFSWMVCLDIVVRRARKKTSGTRLTV